MSSRLDHFSMTPKSIVSLVIGVVALIVLFAINPFTVISAGERGVVLSWGAVTGQVLNEGIHWVTPIKESVEKFDVRLQKEQVAVAAASKDLQTVSTEVALNYHLQENGVASLWQKIGGDYKSRVIDPVIQEAIKAVTAKFTAEELITKRESVKEEARALLAERLQTEYIVVDDLSIVNFSFSPEFENAIEAKQTAQQDALRAENDLRRIKTEAEQRVAQAQAEAQAIRLQSDAANNENYIQLKALEVQLEAVKKWSGVLPSTMVPGAAVPFINVAK